MKNKFDGVKGAGRIQLFIAGMGLRGAGYPNAWNTIRILRTMEGIDVVECGAWLPESFRLWQLGSHGHLRAVGSLAHLFAANAISALRLLLRNRNRSITYIPYPSMFMLWWLSWLPAGWRPRCICDAYITIWDALYRDRRMGSATSLAARLLLCFESRALRAAEVVLVDTQANVEHVNALFAVPESRIRAFPLALETPVPAPSFNVTEKKRAIQVLFIGTFVPLQGATVIARTIDALRGRNDLEFVLIGDGQQAEEAARWLKGHPAVTWLRGWQPPHILAGLLARADICLGVFGGDGKAARVLPFKLYLALAAGKAIITQSAYSTPGTPAIPAVTISPTVDELSAAILDLARNTDQRICLERASASYYREYLGDIAIAKVWSDLLQLVSGR